MPKFVRRQPLIERIKAYLDPADWLLYISEELDTSGWDQLEKEWAIPIGIALNLVFLIARSNQHKQSSAYDDVFGEVKGPGWFAWLVSAKTSCGQTIADHGNVGIIYRPRSFHPLFRQRILHLPAQTTLPSVRDLDRQCTKHTICPASTCSVFPSGIFTTALSF
jgi:hypothetical protein